MRRAATGAMARPQPSQIPAPIDESSLSADSAVESPDFLHHGGLPHPGHAALANPSEPFDPRVPCKTSVMFVMQHERGALLACLGVLAGHGLNLTKLESRPMPGRPFECLFYVDFEGAEGRPLDVTTVDAVMAELEAELPFVRLLGVYPRASA